MYGRKVRAELHFSCRPYGKHGKTTGAGTSWQPVCFGMTVDEGAVLFLFFLKQTWYQTPKKLFLFTSLRTSAMVFMGFHCIFQTISDCSTDMEKSFGKEFSVN